jgi:hypothetical protein
MNAGFVQAEQKKNQTEYRKMKELEDVYNLVREGKISVDDGARKLMEIVYRNKAWFGLYALDMDELHDFLLEQFGKFKRLFVIFDEKIGSFPSFVYGGIAHGLKSWRKMKSRKNFDELAIDSLQSLAYEESLCNYGTPEDAYFCECQSEIPDMGDLNSVAVKKDVDYGMCRRGERTSVTENAERRILKLRKIAVLVLTLKCCNSVDESMIEKAAAVSGKSVEDVRSLVDEARKCTEIKVKRWNSILRTRDKAFLYKRRFHLESEALDKSSLLCSVVSQKALVQDRVWEEKNGLLSEPKKLEPSNMAVGRILGITDRKVKYIMDSASKNMDTLSLSRYYGRHETLFGKRKSEQKAGNE